MTKRLLITFIGRPARQYERTEYRFGDGYLSEPSRFVFHAICGWAAHNNAPVTNSLLLGTQGSAWGKVTSFPRTLTESTLETLEEVEEGHVTAEYLSRCAERLTEDDGEIQFQCELFAADSLKSVDEQLEIVAQLNRAVQGVDELLVDVTHGFRSLGLITVAALRMVKLLNPELKVRLFYGAFDMKVGGVPPVLELEVAPRLDLWARALEDLQERGSFRGLCDALPGPANDARVMLQKAECYLEVNDVTRASSKLQEAAKWFKASGAVLRKDPCYLLVEDEIMELLNTFRPTSRWRLLLATAEFYAGRNAQRTALALFEAMNERILETSGERRNPVVQDRKAQIDRLFRRQGFSTWKKLRKELRSARNAIAHYATDAYAKKTLKSLTEHPRSPAEAAKRWIRDFKALS